MFQPVPRTAALTVRQLIADGSVECLNTFYAQRLTDEWDENTIASKIEELGSAWSSGPRAYQAPNITTVEIIGRDISQEFGPIVTFPMNLAGGNNDEPIPWQCAALVRLTASAAQAPRRGRLFIAGMTNQNVTRGELTPQMATLLTNGVQACVDAIADTDVVPVIVSRWQAGVGRPEGVTNVITGVSTRLVLGSQRDRRAV